LNTKVAALRPGAHRGPRRIVSTVFRQLLFVLYSIVVIYPLIWVIFSSFKDANEIYGTPWELPTILRWDNYVRALVNAKLARYMINSLYITAITLVLLVLVSAMAAYVIARVKFRGQKFFYYLFMGGLVFTVFMVLVPLFMVLKDLKILDSHLGLVLVYIAYSLPFTIFILVGFFRTLPGELAQAARVDGCDEFSTFTKVMLPLAKSGMITAAILNALGIWNEFILAMVIIAKDELRTLPIGIAAMQMRQQYHTDWPALFAGLVIVIVPTFIAYTFFERRLSDNITAGAIKG
jgi:N-acetylglucosamine transport system permease protein